MISIRTINYAVPPEGHFWRWSAGHDAIEWPDGRTLALWPEVHTVLEFLGNGSVGTGGGIPPLGAVLLLLAACRDEWLQQRGFNHMAFLEALELRPHDQIPADQAEVLINGLNAIHSLPKDLRSSMAAKCHLVSALFEGGPYCLPRPESELVLRDLSIFGIGNFGDAKPEMNAKARFFRDIRALKTGLARHDAASLESLLRTGIENSEFSEPKLPQLPSEQSDPRFLLDQLVRSGGESGAAAAVAKRAIAMMNFPGRFGAPRDLPVGGIADITNRGTIDRLLPGELAWDDLVLAARLVHNEALYFRREIPPQHVAVSHTVLLDRGLRLWGTARVFSLGVALGLWHHPALNGPGETFECAAAAPDGFSYLDLATPAGVRAALEVLVPAASPEHFLSAWWDATRIVEDAAIPDVSFVTAREHLDDAATRKLLGGIAGWVHERDGRFRVLAIDRLGALEVQAWSPGGNRVLFRGEIDLAEILQPPAAKKPGPPPLRAQPNPLHKLLPIYSLEQLPFLFPAMPQPSAYLPEPGIGISRDRRLMRWPKPGWGGFEVVARVPGRQHWLGREEEGGIIVIASAEQPGESVRVFRFDKNALHEIEIAASLHAFPRHATVSGGAVVLAYADRVEALSLRSGRRLAEAVLPSLPAAPLLAFDGDRIAVYDSVEKEGQAIEDWSFRDNSWPRIINPDGAWIDGGTLKLKCGSQAYEFCPIRLTWIETKAGNGIAMPFEPSDLSLTPGVTLKIARIGEHDELWLDSRGLLHLLDRAHAETPPWTILLSSPSASAWHPEWAHCSMEPRLRLPSAEEPGTYSRIVLRDFINAIGSNKHPR